MFAAIVVTLGFAGWLSVFVLPMIGDLFGPFVEAGVRMLKARGSRLFETGNPAEIVDDGTATMLIVVAFIGDCYIWHFYDLFVAVMAGIAELFVATILLHFSGWVWHQIEICRTPTIA